MRPPTDIPSSDIPRPAAGLPRMIVLVGFMGAGKSTVGPILARRLGWRFIDADRHLQTRTGSTVAELFSHLGEAAFRRMEADLFAELHSEREVVLALGGGALESEATRSLLAQSPEVCVAFLRAPLSVLIARCESQPGAALRPVLQHREALHGRFVSRRPQYERAQVAVDTDGLDPDAVAELILERLPESACAASVRPKAAIL